MRQVGPGVARHEVRSARLDLAPVHDIILEMDLDHNPIAIGYQVGTCCGLILGGFLADTWLWFAVVVSSTAAGGTLIGLIAYALMRLSARRAR